MKNCQIRKKINNPEGNYPPLHHAIINLSLDLGRLAESPNKKYCKIIPEITFWLFKMDTEVKLGVDCDKDFQQKLLHIKECQDLLALISIGFEHIFRLRLITEKSFNGLMNSLQDIRQQIENWFNKTLNSIKLTDLSVNNNNIGNG